MDAGRAATPDCAVMQRVLALVLALGCGGGGGNGSVMQPAAGGSGTDARSSVGGATAGTGGSAGMPVLPDDGGGSGGSAGSGAPPDAAPVAVQPDAMPSLGPDAAPSANYQACPQGVVNSQGCGHLDAYSRFVPQKKDGYACVICFPRGPDSNPDLSKEPVTGCLVSPVAGQVGLCVKLCGECQ